MATDGQDAQEKTRTETRDYVWRYWAFHADQRLRTFHFFILVATVLVAGILAYLKEARNPAYASPAGLLLAVLCYIFWRLDCRNRTLIRHAEGILKIIERAIPVETVPTDQQLFVQEETKTGESRETHRATPFWLPSRWWHAPLSFYDSFCLIFIVFGLIGAAIAVAAVLLPAQQPPASPPIPQQNFYIGNQSVTPVPGNAP